MTTEEDNISDRLMLGDMLIDAGLVTEEQVDDALEQQKLSGLRLGEVLVQLGFVAEGQVSQILSNQLTIPWANLDHVEFSRELLKKVDGALAEEYCLIPVYMRNVRNQGNKLYVAMDDPLNIEALQRVADCAGMPVKPMVASPTDIRSAIRFHYFGEVQQSAFATHTPTGKIKPPPPSKRIPLASSRPKPATLPSGRPTKSSPGELAAEASELPFTVLDPAAALAEGKLLDGRSLEEYAAINPETDDSEVEGSEPITRDENITTGQLLLALYARVSGDSELSLLPDQPLEPLFATLMTLLIDKGVLTDQEFIDAWSTNQAQS